MGHYWQETICDVRWEGPFSWDRRKGRIKPGHVIYAIYGTHHVYGRNQLLYIGKADGQLGRRLDEHARDWVKGEYDKVRFRVASIGVFPSVEDWWKDWAKKGGEGRYRKAKPQIISQVEALLIYAHQPAYNDRSKSAVDSAEGMLRVFNTGRCGTFLPEISHAYFLE